MYVPSMTGDLSDMQYMDTSLAAVLAAIPYLNENVQKCSIVFHKLNCISMNCGT
jgi:hypothetical protein